MSGWLKPILLVSAGALFVLLFSGEIRDFDIYWHLKTGQYILRTHSLPVPDPFSYLSTGSSYAGEDITRRFNLTHEWLSQVLMYLTWRALGFGGLVIGRVLLLAAFCGLTGWIAFRRTRQFSISLAAALAAAAMSFYFAQSRPFLATLVYLVLTMTILETRRLLWCLPPLFMVWANCHSGFILGWVMCAAYSLESLIDRFRKGPSADARHLWLVSAISILISGFNPNGFRVLEVLSLYRISEIQSTNLEWQRPIFWTPGIYSFLLFGPVVMLLIARRRARLVDWVLYLAFAAISLFAVRNTIVMGLVGPVIIASYLPCLPGSRFIGPAALALGTAGLLAFDITPAVSAGNTLAFRAADWQVPAGAADFIEAHHITARMFNNYETGGYLIWRLWPLQRVFIDARGLSETAFADYRRILYDQTGGKTAMRLLDQYGIDMVVTEGFDYLSGQVYPVTIDLASASSTGWKLVFADTKGVVFLRNPPAALTSLNTDTALLDSLAAQCAGHLSHDPLRPRCAFGLAELYAYRGDHEHARQWISTYIAHCAVPDPEVDEVYQSLKVTDLNKQATDLQSKGKLREAEVLLRQALAIAQRTLGPDHADTAAATNNLATVLESEGSYSEAESLFRRSLEICEKKFGSTDPRTSMALDNLAGVLEAEGDLATAEALLRRAVSDAERALGPDDRETRVIRDDLDALLKARASENHLK